MIKNIIFDLGRVLINFEPKKYLSTLGLSRETLDIYFEDIFSGSEWLDLDRGLIDEEEAVRLISSKGRIEESEVRKILDDRIKFFTEIETNTPLVKKVKDKGYKLYILSNFPKVPFEYISKKYNFFKSFDGGVISYEEGVNVIKPNPKIYNTILTRYNLCPEETLFIDDTLVNIEKAQEYGITGIHLSDHTKLEEKLLAANIIK